MIYIPLFGIVFERYDFITGCVIVYLVQTAITFGFIVKYDHNRSRDVMGIERAKHHLKVCLGIKDSWSLGKLVAATVSLSALLLLFSVPTLFFCYRREGEKGFKVSGVIFIFAAITAKTVLYYTPNVVLWATLKLFVRHAVHIVFG